ncbi:MAG: hypothetical protein HOV81_04525 [Kofleriaceae bacterium]|nr:hypothetical protein [Kofleriaceae bacterium]
MLGLVLATLSCRSTFELDPDPANARPYAEAGGGGTYVVGEPITLDGSHSFDPDGRITSYAWRWLEKPDASPYVTVENSSSAVATVRLAAVGRYVFVLYVTDDANATERSYATIDIEGPHLEVDAGADTAAAWPDVVQLSGTAEVEPHFTRTTEWSFVSRPVGSNATLDNPNSLTPSFRIDAEGTYVVRLTAKTPYNTVTDDVVVVGTVPRYTFGYDIVDAEYSKILERWVTVSNSPATLHVFNPATGTEATVALAFAPTAVGISPDGLRAAVGHDGHLSVVDLQTLAVVNTYPLTIPIGDVVFGTDNRVHCLERVSSGWGRFDTVDLASGTVAITNRTLTGRARLHPSGSVMYATDYGSGLEKFDVTTTPVTFVRRSPSGGASGEMWFTDDGFTMVTSSRYVYYASANPTIDMTSRSMLAGRGSVWSMADAPSHGELAVVSYEYGFGNDPEASHLDLFDDQQFTARTVIPLPNLVAGSMSLVSAGRFVAYRTDGSTLYVIAKAATTPANTWMLYTVAR